MAPRPDPKRIALVAGATGLVGRECLRLLSNDSAVTEVRALVRRPLSLTSLGPRVRECRTDFDQLQSHLDWFAVDWVFCALGTTMRQAVGSRETFRRVDYEYPLVIAKAAVARGATQFLLVSALGANARSRVFYSRVKGELEDAVQGLGYRSVTIARPSFLAGDRQEPRLAEEVAKRLAWLMPARWRPVRGSQVASALVSAAHAERSGVRILENVVLRAQALTRHSRDVERP